MSKRTKYFLIGLAAVLIILMILVLLATRRQPETTTPPSATSTDQGAGQADGQPLPQPPKVFENTEARAETNPVEQTLLVAARNFAERFASFSSDNNFQNLKEVKALASSRLTAELDRQISSGQGPAGNFYGVTSKVLTSQIVSLNEASGDAEVKLTLQRNEERAGQENKVYYQELKLDLISSGESWLVDQAAWQ